MNCFTSDDVTGVKKHWWLTLCVCVWVFFFLSFEETENGGRRNGKFRVWRTTRLACVGPAQMTAFALHIRRGICFSARVEKTFSFSNLYYFHFFVFTSLFGWQGKVSRKWKVGKVRDFFCHLHISRWGPTNFLFPSHIFSGLTNFTFVNFLYFPFSLFHFSFYTFFLTTKRTLSF